MKMTKEEIRKKAEKLAMGYGGFDNSKMEKNLEVEVLEKGTTIFTTNGNMVVVGDGGADMVDESGKVIKHQPMEMGDMIAAWAAVHSRLEGAV